MPSVLVPSPQQTLLDLGWLPRGQKIITNKVMFTFKGESIDTNEKNRSEKNVPERVTEVSEIFHDFAGAKDKTLEVNPNLERSTTVHQSIRKIFVI